MFNIMVRPDDSVALLDFEVAAHVGEGRRPTIGHPGFVAPRDRTGLDVDRYSLACLRLAMFMPLTMLFPLDRGKVAQLAEVITEHFPVLPGHLAGAVREITRRETVLPAHPAVSTAAADSRAAGVQRPGGGTRTNRQAEGPPAVRGGRRLPGGGATVVHPRHSRQRHTGSRGPAVSPLPVLRACGNQTWRLQARIAAQSAVLIPVLQVLVLAVGGIELTRRRISPGELLAASQYGALGAGIGAATGQFNRIARGRSGAARVTELLSLGAPAHGREELPAGGGRIEFRGVAVRANDKAVIENLDLVVPAGTNVALVGGTGSGNSTVAALAGRLIDPSSGDVLLDGMPLTRLACTELRNAVTYAFERPALLGRTVHDTIAFGMARPPDEGVAAAALAARADQFIGRLPGRYQTPLAHAPLSGGEVQRLGLARALAHAGKARVLVLDDATSSLDTVTEMEVSRALTEDHGDRTKIVVTHRAATAARADLVAWLDAGRLQALAPHRELWTDPRYRAVFGSGANTTAETGSA